MQSPLANYTIHLTLGNCHLIYPLPFHATSILALEIYFVYEIEELVSFSLISH